MLSHRWSVNFILLLIVFVLSILVIYTRHQASQASVMQQPLTPLNPNSIQDIYIQRQGQATIHLSRANSVQWQVISPLNLPARAFRVNGLLTVLNRTHYIRLKDDVPDLAALKLNPPAVRLQFNTFSIGLGDIAPLNPGQRYALIGPNVFLLDNNFEPLLGHSVADFVSLFPFGQDSEVIGLHLPEFSIDKAQEAWTLTRVANTELYQHDQIQPAALAALIARWQGLQALNVSLYQPEKHPTQSIIAVQLANEETPLSLHIIRQHPEFILAAPAHGVRYHFSAAQAVQLLNLPTLETAFNTAH